MTGGPGSAGARSGPVVFGIVWAGQLVSIVGSGLTTFALGLWVYGRTGSVTGYALIGLCAVAPRVALSPLAGALVDRWDRRRTMLGAEAGGLAVTLALVMLVATGRLEPWHVYAAAVLGGAFVTFQWPAWSAATTLLVPRRHLGRTAGLVTLAQASSDVVAPLLAAALLLTVGIGPILVLDALSFSVGLAALIVVTFPSPPRIDQPTRPVAHQLTDGWVYLRRRRSLLALVGFLAVVNFLWGIVGALVAPLVLGLAGPGGLAQVISLAGIGMIAGSVLMAAWGGGSRLVRGIVAGELASGAAFVAMGLRPELGLVIAGAFAAHVTIPVIFGCTQAIWQLSVPPELQGRVFAARQMIERAMTPLAFAVAGPLADRVFDPALAPDGALAGPLGSVLGVGPTRGIGLLFVVMGLVQVGLASAAIGMGRRGRGDGETDGPTSEAEAVATL